MTIQIIDDDEDGAAEVASALARAGYTDVRVAHCGRRGLDMAQEAGVELVICDVVLPDLSGFEVCRMLREMPCTSTVGIIQVSGLATATDQRLKAFAAGADIFLGRPLPHEELIANVSALLRRRRRAAQIEGEATAVLGQVERLFMLGLSVMEVVNGLKMPLSVVYAAVSMLKRQKQDARVIRALERASTEMAELLDGVTAPVGGGRDEAEPVGRSQRAFPDWRAPTDLNGVLKGRLLVGTVEPFVRDHVRLDVSLGSGLPFVAAPRASLTMLLGEMLSVVIDSLRQFRGDELTLDVRTVATSAVTTLTIVGAGRGAWPVQADEAIIERAAAGGSGPAPAASGRQRQHPTIPFFHSLERPQAIAVSLGGRLEASWSVTSITLVLTVPADQPV